MTYQQWGWPVTMRGDQIWLNLDRHAVAVLLPVPLATEVATILSTRHCPPLVLAHSDAPEHRVLLAGDRYGIPLPWPPGARQISGAVLLPPNHTGGGPLTWVHRPQPDALRLGREIDLFAALRVALWSDTDRSR